MLCNTLNHDTICFSRLWKYGLNGHNVLHKVKTWADSESDSVTVTTGDCCNNYIWSSVVKSNLYKEKPPEYAYDFECGHELSQNESGEGIEK